MEKGIKKIIVILALIKHCQSFGYWFEEVACFYFQVACRSSHEASERERGVRMARISTQTTRVTVTP